MREVPGGRLLERRQRRRRHAGLRGSWPARRPWQEGDLAGAAGAHRGGVARAAGGAARLVRSSGLHRPVGFRRSRAGLRRHHRHLRHGHDAGPDAVESGQGRRQPSAVPRRRSAHETAHRRWRGWWSFRSRPCPSPVGRRPHRPVRAGAGRVVRQLRPAVLHRRRDRRAGQAARHHAGAVADPLQARRANPVVGRGHRPHGQEGPCP